jgi:hypothetical protein
LERGQSVDLIASVTLGTKGKHAIAIELLWQHENGIEHSKFVQMIE